MATRLTALWGPLIVLALAMPSSAAGDPPGPGPAAGEARAADPAPEAEGAAKTAEADLLRFGPLKLDIDVMARAEAATDFSLSDLAFTPGNDESRLLVRVRPSLSFRPSDSFRARLEGQWYAAWD